MAVIYLVLAATWIVLTDLGALQFVLDPLALTGLQTAKGLFFVTVSAGLLYLLVGREQRRLERTNEQLQLTLRHARVLHRLLRHNLRNSCDVVQNNVALLRADRGDEEAAFERIERQTDALETIAEKSRHLRDIVLAEDPKCRPVDLARVVRDRATTIEEEYSDATITVDGDAEATAVVHPRIGIAIEELLCNGVTHADRTDASVSVTVTSEADAVTVEVADEGPGLPEMEVDALHGDTEDPLAHSRGIGLWLVQFLVAKSAGTVTTRDREPTGTVVSLRFERAE